MVLAEDLRRAVLQAALQGKLTRQLETDSDVDEMLISIQEEKEKLIADKKIKKEKPIPEIQDEEIPFEIPDNWRLARLGEIALYLDAGKSPDCIKENVIGDEWGVITTTAIQANNFCENENKRLPNDFVINRDIKIERNDILITRAGPMTRTGIMCLVENIRFNLLLSDKTVRVNINDENINKKFIVNAINSPCVRLQIINMMSGMDKQQVNISQEKIRKIIIPIPPIEEQQRIVDKINDIMPKIDEYEKIEKELETLKKQFPTNMKDALLQAAMQGKLTEQLESDSSVDELLAVIQKEKEELIAQKKIKKEKSLSDIGEEDIPFDIPENWRWVRWGNLAYSIQYGYNAPAQESGKIKMVRISDIQDNSVNWNSVPYCDISDEEIETYILKENDILFARTGGTVGKSFLVSNVPEDAIYAGYLIRTRYNAKLIPQYLKLFMESQLYWVQLQNGKTQGCQPNCNGQTLSKMMIPLPPIEEQQRIVERLDALLPLCEELKE